MNLKWTEQDECKDRTKRTDPTRRAGRPGAGRRQGDVIAGGGAGVWAAQWLLDKATLDGKPFCIDGQFVTMPPEVRWL